MTKLGRIAAGVLAGLAVFLAVAITLTIGWRPFIGPRARPLTDRKFQSTPARLARGEYLVHSVTDCMGCHAEHDWTAHDAPVPPNAFGAGQDMNFVKGLPGKVYAPNITPDPETGAGNWRDVGRRPGIGHCVFAVDSTGAQAAPGNGLDLPREISDPRRAPAAHRSGAGTRSFHS
jgi:hypothetical protein